MPLAQSRDLQAGMPIHNFGYYAELAGRYPFDAREVGNSLVVREPIGVVGCITPWNFPLHQIAPKVAPALAAGCTVVLKPSEVAPLDAFLLAEVLDAVGLPPGVFNLVSGTARSSGRPSPRIPASTWSRSRARRARAPGSRRSRRRP